MKINLERKCTVSHKWHMVAAFHYAVDAGDAARALSKMDNGTYRTTDTRWPDEGDVVTVYTNGEISK
jgi:hypothetical protein